MITLLIFLAVFIPLILAEIAVIYALHIYLSLEDEFESEDWMDFENENGN